MKKMLVIDGNSILNRAYYGIRPLTNKDGLFTHAVFGMVTMISRHIDALRPDYCVVAFDLKAPTFRHKMSDSYKANRKGMPEELAVQLPYAKRCMTALGFKVLSLEGYEADDILGTMSRIAFEEGVASYVLTGDRDSLQLIRSGISVLLVKTKETLTLDPSGFEELYGIKPEQFVDVKALMGDSSDNISGVAGIGEKTAFKLISEFGSLDGLYSRFEESALSDSVKRKLRDGRDSAYLSRALAKINVDAPIEIGLEACEYNGPRERELYELFLELEFDALIKKFGLEELGSRGADEEIGANADGEKPLVEIGAAEARRELCGERVAAHIEGDMITVTDGARICRFDASRASVDALSDIMLGSDVVCHDYKQLYKKLLGIGIRLEKCKLDTMLAAYVLDAGRGKYELDTLARAYLGEVPSELSVGVLELSALLEKRIDEDGCGSLLYDVEIPLARVLGDMELVGFGVDAEGIRQYGEELGATAEAIRSRIYMMAGEEFNLNSPKQLGEVLFEKMGLPSAKKTKTGYSTDAETLNKLRSKHEIIDEILDYRQLVKLRSTYADGLLKAIGEDGRIHTVFNQTGTATGRLSSAEPNLQNIPIKTELGRRFRKYFIPRSEDYVIIDADYSQIELRLLAHISGDEAMIGAFEAGEDIHRATASAVFGVEPEQVTSELRKKAKAVNFGIVYGIGEYSLSEDIGVSMAQAKKYIESYLGGFPRVAEYLNGIKEKAREKGYVTTEFGRRRYIPEINASNKNLQHFGERVAMNSPIQGTAADIIKIAMIEVSRELEKMGVDAYLLLQVHDELIIEAHRSCAEEVKNMLVERMENAVKLSVSLDVEANVGNNWYDAK